MRELKFRAWRTEEKKMYAPVFFDNLEVYWWGEDGENSDTELLGDRMAGGMLEHCILLQYTGLKDKNGKEIFEGDVVTDGEIVGQVVFHDKRFMYGNKAGNLAWCVKHKDSEKYVPLGPCEDGYTWEIVGNPYEQPGAFEWLS